MKITVNSSDLARELANVDRVVDRKVTIPVLANVLIEVGEGGVTLSATDLHATMRCRLPGAAVGRRGSVTLPVQKLGDLSRSLGGLSLDLEQDGTAIKLSAGNFKSRLQTLPADDFPSLPTSGNAPVFTLPRAALREIVERVRFVATMKDTRYYLNGAQLEVSPDKIEMASSDGHRLAVASVRAGTGATEKATALMPKKNADALAVALDDPAESVQFASGENHLFFTIGTRLFSSRLIDGTFPQYERLMPKPSPTPATVQRTDLLSALRRAMMVASASSQRVEFSFVKGSIGITSESAEVGAADETVAADYVGGETRIAFNAGYLADFLDTAASDSIALHVTVPEMPMLCTEVRTPAGVDYRYVIMPMR